MRRPKALITGITGQDGWHLNRLLRAKGYQVHGLSNRRRAEGSMDEVFWHLGDITDAARLLQLIEKIGPDEIYNLGAISQVRISFEMPVSTGITNTQGTLTLLEAIRQSKLPVRLFQPSSSDMFGTSKRKCDETTPFRPRSPYAASKLAAYWLTANYREAYGMFACNGILFNHESPQRPPYYVTRKITRAAAFIKRGLQERLSLGNLDISRDWGYAGDTVDAMWRMLQHKKPDDYVVATGETHSLREFLDEAFACVGLEWRDYVTTDPAEFRPTDIDTVSGDSSKARRVLKWKPTVGFRELVRMMVEADLA